MRPIREVGVEEKHDLMPGLAGPLEDALERAAR